MSLSGSLWVVLGVVIAGLKAGMTADDRAQQWEQVTKAIRAELPQTALEHLKPLLAATQAGEIPGETARAILWKVMLEGNHQGLPKEDLIAALEQEILTAPPSTRPVLTMILALWHISFVNHNWTRLLERSVTDPTFEERNLATWDLPRLGRKINRLFDEALAEEKILRDLPLSTIGDLLADADINTEVRPTLFDFFAHQMLEFYASGMQEAARPEDGFSFEATVPLLGSCRDVLAFRLETPATDSPKVKAFLLYQRLLRVHSASGHRTALLDTDFHRLIWARSISDHDNASEQYVATLTALAEEHRDHPLSSAALEMAAKELQAKNRLAEAHELAVIGETRFPHYLEGDNCQTLRKVLETKSLDVCCERVIGKTLPDMRIDFTNLERVSFRLLARNAEVELKGYKSSLERPFKEEWPTLVQQASVLEWQVDLPAEPRFTRRTHWTPFPRVPQGLYYLLASGNPDFSLEDNAVRLVSVWVSSLGLVCRSSQAEEGLIEGVVVDNDSGAPLRGAQIAAYRYEYKGAENPCAWDETDKTVTDEDGRFRFKTQEKSVLTVVRARGETLFDTDVLSLYISAPKASSDQLYLFTDRAIYRPGQIIHFKGVIIRSNADKDQHQTVADAKVTLTFRDVNNTEITRLECQSNAFGSISGTFIAPQDRLTGKMSIQSADPVGTCTVSIEEYKRPKFQVEINPCEAGFSLGKKVTVSGKAQSYAGAPIESATVKYRVIREVRMPWWWLRWNSNPPKSRYDIAHGNGVTDSTGAFSLSFAARPDPAISAKDRPAFLFRVVAEVTDEAGETRTASRIFCFGYVGLEISIDAPDWIEAGAPFPMDLKVTTLDQNGVAATGTWAIHAVKTPSKPVRVSMSHESGPSAANIAAWELGPVVKEGTFTTGANGAFSLPVTLPVGVYRILASSRDASGGEATASFEIAACDSRSNRFPVPVHNLLMRKSSTLRVGETFEILWGTGHETGRAFVEIECRGKRLQSFWTNPQANQQVISFPVGPELQGGFTLRVSLAREGLYYMRNQVIDVPWSQKELALSFEHFSFKLQPGRQDTWNIKISGPGADLKAIEMVAALYDASLDQFVGHAWLKRFPGLRAEVKTNSGHFSSYLKELEPLSDYPYVSSRRGEFGYPELARAIIELTLGRPLQRGSRLLNRLSADDSRDMARGMARVMAQTSLEPGEMLPQEGADSGSGTPKGPAEIDLESIRARFNFNETAFFFPHLTMDQNGVVTITFTIPEALTTWKFLGFAHGKGAEAGLLTAETLTQKPLMVQPNAPRFLREGDRLEFTTKITNLSDVVQIGKTRLTLSDLASGESRDREFGLAAPDQEFEIPARASKTIAWSLLVPDGAGVIAYKVVAASDQFSDGEEAYLPVLSRRQLVVETLPLSIRGPATKQVSLKKLVDSAGSDTLQHQSLSVQMTSNPSWYAVMALPYLMEFPHECSEQTFNRLYANGLAHWMITSDPNIRRVLAAWKADEASRGDALHATLEQNADLRTVLLQETPWVRHAESENAARHRLALLFDENHVNESLSNCFQKLAAMQLSDASWPWFPGGQSDIFITLYVVAGFGRLRHMGVKVNPALAQKALAFVDAWLIERYVKSTQPPANTASTTTATTTTTPTTNPATTAVTASTVPMATPTATATPITTTLATTTTPTPATPTTQTTTPTPTTNTTATSSAAMTPAAESPLTHTIALYLYGRSFFLTEAPLSERLTEAVTFFRGQAEHHWTSLGSRLSQGQIALGLHRLGDQVTPKKITASLRERSLTHEEFGRYWQDQSCFWLWHHATIETQALMIEVFAEIEQDEAFVDDCRIWLLKQKQTRDWGSSKATADAVYALLFQEMCPLRESENPSSTPEPGVLGKALTAASNADKGLVQSASPLASDKLVKISLGGRELTPEKTEAGTGFFEKRFAGRDILANMGEINLTKEDKGIAWGGVFWQYLEDLRKITPANTGLRLKKSLYIRKNSPQGMVITPLQGKLVVGDRLVVRVEITSDRSFEYVHLKDGRGSGLEPVNVLSAYRVQDGLSYYQSTKDSASHFYFSWLPKGTFVIEYDLWVQLRGSYQSGIAELQCMYAPAFSCHSESILLEVV